MNLVIFSHPTFFPSQSMPRFARMLADGMVEKGHKIEVWSPRPHFFRIPLPGKLKKWLGYIDQYIVFPSEVRRRLKSCPPNTLFVVADQALGIWVPLVANRQHVIHCHDFLAQQAALGEISEQSITWTGRQYQALIRRGFSKGKHFISVSEITRMHLTQLVAIAPKTSEVVYNQIASIFQPRNVDQARKNLSSFLENDDFSSICISRGYILHVGLNVWYKNRRGVLEIYEAWSRITQNPVPLIIIGDQPDPVLLKQLKKTDWGNKVLFLNQLSDEQLADAYAGAYLLLFPSLEEGFGWPIAEAMACGCPVITTDKAPMTEVGGNAAIYISRRPEKEQEAKTWAEKAASKVNEVITMMPKQREKVIDEGLQNIKRFNREQVLDEIEKIYKRILTRNDIATGAISQPNAKSPGI